MSKGINICFAVAAITSCILSFLSLRFATELSAFYHEFIGPAGASAAGDLILKYGHWAFLVQALAVGLIWWRLQCVRADAPRALYFLLGLTGVQMALILLGWIGSAVPLFKLMAQLGSAG